MKRIMVLILMSMLVLSTVALSGCGDSEAAKQAAYEAGKKQANDTVKRSDTKTTEGDAQAALNDALKNHKEKGKNKTSGVSSSVAQSELNKLNHTDGNSDTSSSTTYVIDTLNNRVHKHNSGCSLMGDESGRATIEKWDGTLSEAVAAGYTKCPECILNIGN